MRRVVRQGANRARKQSFEPVVRRTPEDTAILFRTARGRNWSTVITRVVVTARKRLRFHRVNGLEYGEECSVTDGRILALAVHHLWLDYEIRDVAFRCLFTVWCSWTSFMMGAGFRRDERGSLMNDPSRRGVTRRCK